MTWRHATIRSHTEKIKMINYIPLRYKTSVYAKTLKKMNI